jgi:hypothetical protein
MRNENWKDNVKKFARLQQKRRPFDVARKSNDSARNMVFKFPSNITFSDSTRESQ